MGNIWSSSSGLKDRYATDLNARDDSGWIPLVRQVRGRDLAGVERLVARGADVDATGVGGMTPLMVAASTGFLDAVAFLLAHGASVSAADKFGKTPLMFAARYGHTAVTRLLISSGADVNAQDRDGHSPLMFSAESGHSEVVAFLVADNINIQLDPTNKNGWTPLMFACSEGHFEIAWFLLANFAAINAPDNNRRTPLMVAAQSGHLDVATLLLAREPRGAGATLSDKMDNSALVMLLDSYWNQRLTEDELLPLVDLMLSKGANPAKRNTDGVSAVTIALQKGFLAILEWLLEGSVRHAVAPVVGQPRWGWSPRSSREPESEPTTASLPFPSWESSGARCAAAEGRAGGRFAALCSVAGPAGLPPH